MELAGKALGLYFDPCNDIPDWILHALVLSKYAFWYIVLAHA